MRSIRLPRWLQTATLLLGSTLIVLSGAVISPNLPYIAEHYAKVPNGGLWVRMIMTLPALMVLLSASVLGWLMDRIGRRPFVLGSVIIFAVAGVSSYWVEPLWGLLLLRALVGLGVAGSSVGFTTLIADLYVGKALDRYLGLQAVVMAI